MLSNIGGTELIIIGSVMLFLFGGRKLPELAKGVADSVREVKKAVKE